MTSVVIDLIRSFEEGGLNVIDLEILNNILNSKTQILSSQQKQYMVSNIFFSVWENRWSQIFYEI